MKQSQLEKQARKVLSFPKDNEKIICFISGWEKHRELWPSIESKEKDYLLNEQFIFSIIRDEVLKNSQFSFLLSKGIKEYGKAKNSEDNEKVFVPAIMPFKEEIRDYLNEYQEELFIDSFRVEVLCLEYDYFDGTILYQFLRYHDNLFNKINAPVNKNLKPLHRLFRSVSPDVKSSTFTSIKEIIEKTYNNKLTLEDRDRIEHLSSSHLQNIEIPQFWNNVRKNGTGYLCSENSENLKFIAEKKTDDFLFFYSLSSLLFYELKKGLIKAIRCENCLAPLPTIYKGKTFKGKHCQEGMDNYLKCVRERGKKRQKKFKEELKKF